MRAHPAGRFEGVGVCPPPLSSSCEPSGRAPLVAARIASLVVVRDRLRDLAEMASSVQDVLAVERELARVQSEIDSMQARLDLLRSTAALARVSVRVQRPVVLGPISWLVVGAGRLLAKLFIIG